MIDFAERKPFASFAVLILANLLLLSVQVRTAEGRILLRSWGLAAVTPILISVDYVSETVSTAWNRYVFLVRTARENERIKQENAALRLRLSRLQGLEGMVRRVRRLDNVRTGYFFDTLLAGVIWRGDLYAHRLVINVGSNDGVVGDAAVLTPEGVLGRVVTTTPWSAEVELLSSAGAAAGAVVGESRVQGIIQGTGERKLQLNFVPNSEPVAVGAMVYTAGTDRIYPKDLPIGRVIESGRGNTYRTISVEPITDYLRLEEVLVVAAAGALQQQP